MKQKIYTSLNLSEDLRKKLDLCAEKLEVDQAVLLSVLSYKAGTCISSEAKCFQVVDYQERGGDYEITPVCFFASDHEYLHANRLARKVSVSKLLACAMALFLDEIIEKGINQLELLSLQKIENSYKQNTYIIQNCTINIVKNDQFEKYIMGMRMKKHKT